MKDLIDIVNKITMDHIYNIKDNEFHTIWNIGLHVNPPSNFNSKAMKHFRRYSSNGLDRIEKGWIIADGRTMEKGGTYFGRFD